MRNKIPKTDRGQSYEYEVYTVYVAEAFKSLPNKYCALDPVSAELYKQCLQHLCSYVKYIINSSLSQGIVPTSFKEALVKPKLKSDRSRRGKTGTKSGYKKAIVSLKDGDTIEIV